MADPILNVTPTKPLCSGDICPNCQDAFLWCDGMLLCRCDEEWFFDSHGKT